MPIHAKELIRRTNDLVCSLQSYLCPLKRVELIEKNVAAESNETVEMITDSMPPE